MAKRIYAKVDANQKEIVEALRKAGATVLSIAMVGKGAPDIIIGHRQRNILVEIKQEKGTLTPDELNFHQSWLGQVCIIRTLEEALALLN